MSQTVCECRSPQEQRLLDKIEGKVDRFRATHERVFRMLERFDGMKPRIDIERALYFTQSMQETEGQPLVLRWAKALMHIARNITVYVQDDQLLLGRAGCDGRYGILYPELDGDFLDMAVKDLPTRATSPATITAEDAKRVIEEIAPYWKGKTYHEALAAALPPEIHKLTYDDPKGLISRFIVNQWVHDYGKILKRGFNDIKREAEEKLAALDPASATDMCEKKPFLDAVVIVCDAIVLWARRHADEARKVAEKTDDPVRKAELLRMAANAERVPGEPARDFWEACQSQWFVQMFSRIEQKTGTTISNGRMDQQLISYYRQDIKAGILDEKKALEILGCMWCQMAQFIELPLSPGVMDTQAGFAHWEAVTIGGQTTEGLDATNELTYLLLKSKREFPTHYPDLAVRVHARTPQRLLWDVAETIKQGQGYPKLLNDEELIPRMLAKGAPASEVFDYVVSGCNETRLINRESYMSPGTQVNLGAALELVLRNGRLKKFGDELFTFETGDPCSFKTWEEFWDAYVKQQNNLIKSSFMLQDTIHHTRAKFFASPLASGLHSLCMDSCVDLNSDVAPEGALDIAFFDAIGFGTVVDSLSAIKTLVFEQKRLSMKELLEALDCNFEGKEDIQALLQGAPSFGNGDLEVDTLGRMLEKSALDFTARYAGKNGVQPLEIRTTSVTANVPHGKFVGATPNGRKAWMPLSDGSSPSHGSDRNGPTAVLLSQYQSTNWNAANRACRLLNMKMAPKTVEGDEGTKKLVDLIRAFINLRVWHLQMNIINRETLVAAQKDPQKYKNLVVRIAGYSAYFVDLSPDLQNDLIDRTEQENCD